MANLSFKQQIGVATIVSLVLAFYSFLEGAPLFASVCSTVFIILLMVWGPADNSKPTKRSNKNEYTPKV